LHWSEQACAHPEGGWPLLCIQKCIKKGKKVAFLSQKALHGQVGAIRGSGDIALKQHKPAREPTPKGRPQLLAAGHGGTPFPIPIHAWELRLTCNLPTHPPSQPMLIHRYDSQERDMSSKHSNWSWHCLSLATIRQNCHMLYVMVVHELAQICLWI
jgi:hypothetical protein